MDNGRIEIKGLISLTEDAPYTRYRLCQSFGEGSEVFSEVWLPEDWNGIFVGLGNGGLAGRIDHGALDRFVKNGYAVAQTDMGTRDGRLRGVSKSEVWKDFGWRSTHEMTAAAKQLIRKMYGRDAEYSYFIGESTGGQQAFSEAQRFPLDYDGIIAGVPANNRVFLHTYFLWSHNCMVRADGTVLFSDAEISDITSLAVRFFQMHGDGEKGDNFVSYPWLGVNTVELFIEFLRSESELSEEQLGALRAVYDGPRDPKTGRRIYNGLPIGSEKFGCGIKDCQNKESPHFYPFVWTFGADYLGDGFDFSSELDKVHKTLSEELNANSPELAAFNANGGKLIAFSGSSDPCVPYPDAMRYYERAVDVNGGYEKTADFFRYFLIPGRDHGNGGDGANGFWGQGLLEKLRNWREHGVAPEYVTAARHEDGKVLWERKVYNYLSKGFPKKELPPTCDEFYLK